MNTIDSCIDTLILCGLNPVVAAPPAYPFIGGKAVRAVLEANGLARHAVTCLMYHLQTPVEQETRDTKVKNHAGFMSSDSHVGTIAAEKLIAGEELTLEEEDRLTRMAPRYWKQTTLQLRRAAMVEQPALAAYAQVFSAA